MYNFTYWNPTRLHFGKDQVAKLTEEIPLKKKVLVLYGGGSIKSNGVYKAVMNELKNHTVFEFSGIEPNPHYETLMKAVQMVRENKIDFLLAVGGGSVIDGTKFVSVASPFTQDDPWKIVSERIDTKGHKVPFGCVLTLPATGSEMNKASVVTLASKKEKRGFIHNDLFPQFSILDPTMTYSLPKEQISNGIADAFVHVIEQYLTYPVDSPLQDRFAEAILTTLIEEGPKALVLREDYNVRANLMWCATMALQGLIGCGVPQDWSTHMIGHELTAEYGLAHGTTLAIVLPSTLREMKNSKKDKLVQYAERVWKIKNNNTDALIEEAIMKTQSFFEAIGIRTKLRDYKIEAHEIDRLMSRLGEKNMFPLGERQNMDQATCQRILTASL